MSKKLLHTPEGVRDIYGDEYERKLTVSANVHHTMNLFGYQDIQTPSFEFFDVFSQEIGTTPSKELYKFFDKEGNTLVLRPDFTPSIARCAAKYFADEPGSLRFCYQGNAFCNTTELQGKLKESTQIGSELIGDDSAKADAEIAALMIESLLSSGLKNFQISIGEVDYFKGICDQAGLSDEMKDELREFVSIKNYFGAEEYLIRNNVPELYRNMILKAADLFGDADVLREAKATVSNQRSLDAINRLLDIYDALCAYGLEKYVSFDLGMLSKYNYYTGVIMKAYTYGIGDAVANGGRYDSLLSCFGKNKPAIGFMIVIDSLMEALRRQKIDVEMPASSRRITYTDTDYFEKVAEAERLRGDGVSVILVPEVRA